MNSLKSRFNDPRPLQPVFHYTTGDRFMKILASGEIRPTSQHIVPPEIPAVWLSTASTWEYSATKGVIIDGVRREATLRELVQICGFLARIQIDALNVALIQPNQLARDLCIPNHTLERLLIAGRLMGAEPVEWRAVANPVPVSAFLRVEFAVQTEPLRWLPLAQRPQRPANTH